MADDRSSDQPLPGLGPDVPERLRPFLSTCTTCRAQIIRAVHVLNGRRAPIDPIPQADGNIALTITDGTRPGSLDVAYRVPPQSERETLAGRLHVSHFVTCPQAKLHRHQRRH